MLKRAKYRVLERVEIKRNDGTFIEGIVVNVYTRMEQSQWKPIRLYVVWIRNAVTVIHYLEKDISSKLGRLSREEALTHESFLVRKHGENRKLKLS